MHSLSLVTVFAWFSLWLLTLMWSVVACCRADNTRDSTWLYVCEVVGYWDSMYWTVDDCSVKTLICCWMFMTVAANPKMLRAPIIVPSPEWLGHKVLLLVHGCITVLQRCEKHQGKYILPAPAVLLAYNNVTVCKLRGWYHGPAAVSLYWGCPLHTAAFTNFNEVGE